MQRHRDTRALTGLRAVALVMVIGTHAAFGTGHGDDGYLGALLSRLEIGVAVFFVVSGYLLFRPWVEAAADGTAPPQWRRYAERRIRRIAPAYLLTVIVVYLWYELLPVPGNPGHDWVGLLRHLTLTQIYTGDFLLTFLHQGLTQTWSLAVEVSFYAVLPFLAHWLLTVVCRRRWRPRLLLSVLGLLAATTPVFVLVVSATDWLPTSAGMWLPANLMWFVAGMALAVLRVLGVNCYGWLALPVAAASYLIVATPIAGSPTVGAAVWQPVAKVVLYGIIATLVVAPLVLGPDAIYARLLGSRPLVTLGAISYEMFLLHVVVMDIAMHLLRWHPFTGSVTVLAVLTTALTVPAASWLHRLTRPASSHSGSSSPALSPPER